MSSTTTRHDILSLRPTQMTIGLTEITRRQAKFKNFSKAQFADYLHKRPVPCVVGPKGALFIVDHHHLCRALHDHGIDRVDTLVETDASQLTDDEFWRYLDLANLVHPFDADGIRRPHRELPTSIDKLADDPYRALASMLRREQGFTKQDRPFEEFLWADFLRHRIAKSSLRGDGWEQAVADAIGLAQSKEARHLPGWRGK